MYLKDIIIKHIYIYKFIIMGSYINIPNVIISIP